MRVFMKPDQWMIRIGNHNRGEKNMSYYFRTQLKSSFDDAVTLVYEALKNAGFGVLTEIFFL